MLCYDFILKLIHELTIFLFFRLIGISKAEQILTNLNNDAWLELFYLQYLWFKQCYATNFLYFYFFYAMSFHLSCCRRSQQAWADTSSGAPIYTHVVLNMTTIYSSTVTQTKWQSNNQNVKLQRQPRLYILTPWHSKGVVDK